MIITGSSIIESLLDTIITASTVYLYQTINTGAFQRLVSGSLTSLSCKVLLADTGFSRYLQRQAFWMLMRLILLDDTWLTPPKTAMVSAVTDIPLLRYSGNTKRKNVTCKSISVSLLIQLSHYRSVARSSNRGHLINYLGLLMLFMFPLTFQVADSDLVVQVSLISESRK